MFVVDTKMIFYNTHCSRSPTLVQLRQATRIYIRDLNVGTALHKACMCFVYCMSTCLPQNGPYLHTFPVIVWLDWGDSWTIIEAVAVLYNCPAMSTIMLIVAFWWCLTMCPLTILFPTNSTWYLLSVLAATTTTAATFPFSPNYHSCCLHDYHNGCCCDSHLKAAAMVASEAGP